MHPDYTTRPESNETVVLDNLSTGRTANIRHLLGTPGYGFARADLDDGLVLDRLSPRIDLDRTLESVAEYLGEDPEEARQDSPLPG